MESELKPVAAKRHHRVIVNVTDDAIADEMLGSSMSTMLRRNKTGNNYSIVASSARKPIKKMDADIEVLNCTTLSLSRKSTGEQTNHVMFFDCVGRTESDPLVRYELGTMFDLLMIDRRNCCLVNFKPMRERPSNFFNNYLVPEIEKRLMMLQGTMSLRSIKLEYHDVQKYDVVNMCESVKTASKKSKNKELIFQNTREFLRWIQRSYPIVWSNGTEHDCFDIEFVFAVASKEHERISGSNNKVSVKLSIALFYLNKMDGDLRAGLRNFLENVNQTDFRMKHSILTDYLREYFFNEEDSWQIYMLFDVPSVNFGSSLANDMLTLASSAYAGVHNTNMLLNNADVEVKYVREHDISRITRQSAGQHSRSTLMTGEDMTPTSSSSVLRPNRASSSTTKTENSTKIGNYSLSFWYCRIDKCFANVMTSLERYYNRKYELKVQKISVDLKNNEGTLDDSDIEADDLLQHYGKEYKEALAAYRVLIKKTERTRYSEKLNNFVKTKNSDIAKQTREMKMRLLELSQSKISNPIKMDEEALSMETTIKESDLSIPNELMQTFKSS